MRIISEKAFQERLTEALEPFHGVARAVTGPGRSGAVASVYASHMLKVPWLPAGGPVPEKLRPVLVVDTASKSGRTLRKMARRVETDLVTFAFLEPPRVHFWYEVGH